MQDAFPCRPSTPQMGALGDLGYDHQALLDTLCDEVGRSCCLRVVSAVPCWRSLAGAVR